MRHEVVDIIFVIDGSVGPGGNGFAGVNMAEECLGEEGLGFHAEDGGGGVYQFILGGIPFAYGYGVAHGGGVEAGRGDV